MKEIHLSQYKKAPSKIDWQVVWNTRYLNESLKLSLLQDVMDLIEREVEAQLNEKA